MNFARDSKVRSLFEDGKQTAGCTNFCTETRLFRPVSVRNPVHPAVCLPSLKRERTLVRKGLTTFLRMISYFADVLIRSDNKTRRQEAEGETFLKYNAITVIYLSFFSRRRTTTKEQ